MDRNRRDVLRGLGAAGGAAFLTGCVDDSGEPAGSGDGSDGGDGDGNETDGSGGAEASDVTPTEAELWHALTGAETETLEESLAAFQEGSDAEITHEGIGDLRNRVEHSLSSGDGPEMYRWAQDWAGGHYERDFLYDASDDIGVDPAETFSSSAYDAVTVDGDDAVVGLPVAGESLALLYNRDLVDAPPQTFKEMEQIMAVHYDPNNGKYGLSHPIDAYFASPWLHAFGGYYFRTDENGEPETGMDRDATKRGMEFLRDGIWEYMPEDVTYEPQARVFRNGNAPLAINGPWAVSEFEDADVDVGVAPLPEVRGNTPTPYAVTEMWYFSARMGEDEGRRRAALDYAEWIATGEERQLAMAERHNSVPVLSSIPDGDLPADMVGFKQSYDDGVPMPNHRAMSDVWTPVEDAMNAVLLDDAGIDSRFDRAAEEIRSAWDR